MDNKENIRIAVCISGAVSHSLDPRSCGSGERSFINNNNILKHKFPTADFYFATWDKYQSEFEAAFANERCEYFTEPDIHYHPYTDIAVGDHISSFYQGHVKWAREGGEQRLNWLQHSTKQLLIHTWLSDKIKNDYDIIVRARYDGFTFKDANFEPYVRDTFKTHSVNGFTATKPSRFATLLDVDRKQQPRHNVWIMDNLIIHDANAIDIDYVNALHTEKKLHASEYGWYQILSMPHGSKHNNHNGWVCPDDRVLDEFLWTP